MDNQVVMQKKKGFRVVLFPLPYQGHLNPMLQLGNILHSVGFTITIIHTKFNAPNHSNYPHFTFYSIPDDSPETQSDTAEVQTVIDLIAILNRNCEGPFRDCLARMISDDSKEPIACIITDAHWYCTQAVANSFNIRRIVLRTSSLSSFLVFAAHPLCREKGYLSISNQGVSYLNHFIFCKFLGFVHSFVFEVLTYLHSVSFCQLFFFYTCGDRFR